MFRRVVLAWVALGAAVIVPSAAHASMTPGYTVVLDERVGPGVEHIAYARPEPQEIVHVARIAPDAPFALRAVPASEAMTPVGGLERTSAICVRLGCRLAVNGDFWEPQTGLPIGGLVSNGRLLRSPEVTHNQLVLEPNGRLSTGDLKLNGTLVSTDLRTLTLHGVDAPIGPDGVILYTPAAGNAVKAGSERDLVLRVVRPSGVLHLRRTVLVRVESIRNHPHATSIPRDGAVVSARGAGVAQLDDLWERTQSGAASPDALLRLDSTPAALESVGGSPVLVRDGKIAVPDVPTDFVRGRHPRTLVGRTASGDALLVTVDGRQPGYSAGMSLAEAARLMSDLGAVDAINLDGGGSTTFVKAGAVANRPSDRAVVRRGHQRIVKVPARGDRVIGQVERPVAVALVVVPRAPAAPDDPSAALRGIELPRVLALAAPQASDPGSDLAGGLPAIVATPAKANYVPWLVAVLIVIAGVLALVAFRRFRAEPLGR